jgi:hypothetical protein
MRKPTPFAADTKVPVAQSQAEIEALVKGRGAESYMRGDDQGRAVVTWSMHDRRVMFELPLEPVKKAAKESQSRADKLERQLWRALYLCIKAKLVSVETGVESFEDAFLAQLVVPTSDGRAGRLGRLMKGAIEEAYKKGTVPNFGSMGLLPSGTEKPE